MVDDILLELPALLYALLLDSPSMMSLLLIFFFLNKDFLSLSIGLKFSPFDPSAPLSFEQQEFVLPPMIAWNMIIKIKNISKFSI
jgi:hypothetical protein